MEIIIDILKVLLLCALVLGILQLLAKCCKFQLPKWLRWNKVRTWITIIVAITLVGTWGLNKLINKYGCETIRKSGCCSHKDNPSLDVCDPCYYDECNFKILIKNLTN